MKNYKYSKSILSLIKKLYPINRSLTGNGNRKSLNLLKSIYPKLKVLEYKCGQNVFDWKIPSEWNVNNAYIKCGNKKIVDFKKNNLHLMSYSIPINKLLTFNELNENLYSLKDTPNAIPYVTSYYKRKWGFCIEHKKRIKLDKTKKYKAVIDSTFKENGSMSLGEILIKGKSKEEILLSTNICHPSMVNNELCAPSILTHIAKYFSLNGSHYTLRILFLPETIGSISYLKKNLKTLKKNFRAGFQVSCFGDKGNFSMISTKYNNSYSDKIAKNIIKKENKYKIYPFKSCGSDERQYNFPGINLPVVTLTRSKFGEFKEYHNSLDDLKITNNKSLDESFNFLVNIIETINKDRNDKSYKKQSIIRDKSNVSKKNYTNFKVYSLTKCEPFLSKRKLYRDVSDKTILQDEELIMFNLLYYGDGIRISQISKILSFTPKKILKIAKILEKNKLIKLSNI